MPTLPKLRIFISSPGDVVPERRRAKLVIEKLAKEYRRFFEIAADLWETEPMLASGHFQDNITPPADSDIVVLIVWSRLGTPLPEKTARREYRGIDGRVPVTGTEWEFESALQAQQDKGAPDLLAYRKTANREVSVKDPVAKATTLEQWDMLDAFWNRHFLNLGIFKAAFSEFADLDSFETKLESDLRALIDARIKTRAPSPVAPPVWTTGSPFRGLDTYRYEHHEIFFGRSAATRTAVEQLTENADKGRAFLLILGASGAGKSSLAQAGILPALVGRGIVSGVGMWRWAVMRPAGNPEGPFAALADALLAKNGLPELLAPGQNAAPLARHLEASIEDPAFSIVSKLNEIAEVARSRGDLKTIERAHIAIVIDQLEELFTATEITAEDRTAFVRCLDGLARSGGVFVIATMRSDYWHRAPEIPLLGEIASGRGRLDLLPASQSEIIEMIRQPAQAAGVDFDTDPVSEHKLDADLAEQAAREPGALPLLSFLLDALYRKDIEEGKGSILTYPSMREAGGLIGAIASRAESVFTALPAEDQAVLPKVLRALVTVSRSGAEPTARAVAIANFPEGGPERRVVEALIDARLLVAEGDGEGARIRLAHEALLTHWERAKQQIAQDRDDLRVRTAVEEAEAEWQRASPQQKQSYLLRDPQLANALDLARRWDGELPPELHAFVARSDAAARAVARRRRTIASAVMLCLAVLAMLSAGALYLAEGQRNGALVAQSFFLARDARAAAEGGNATLGVLLALAALPGRVAAPDRPFVLAAEDALETAVMYQRERTVLQGHEDKIWLAAFSPDGARIITASNDKTARVWDANTGAQIAVLQHEDRVRSAAFSPDGARIVTASDDQSARLWDAKTGAQIAVLRHEGWVIGAAFSPDGARIVTASLDRTARLWDAKTGAQIAVLQHEDFVFFAAFSPDSARIVTASNDKTARLWDAKTGAQIAMFQHEDRVRSAAFSPDGARIVTASDDQTARLWDANTGAQIAVFQHEDRVRSAAFSPDGFRIVTASDDKTARLWDAKTLAQIAVLRHEGWVISAAFSPDGARIVTASDDQTARLWNAQTGARIAVLRGHEDTVTSAAFSPDGARIVTASDDKTARLWDATPGAQIAVFQGHELEVISAAFSPDGARIVTASMDRTAQLWDANTGARIAVLQHEDRVRSAAFSPDGARIVTASNDKTARLWDAKTGAQIAVLRHEGWVRSAAFSPDGFRIVTASDDKTARLWDAKTGAQIAVLQHEDFVFFAAFSPDGARIVTASNDKTARVWAAITAAQIAVLRGHEALLWSAAFSPDGARIVTASDDQTARLWDANTGAQIAVLQHEDRVRSAAFSPDGFRIVTASDDQTARLWAAKTGAQIAVLRGHEDSVISAAFSPDGTRIVTASLDGTARMWDARTGARIAVLRGHENTVTSAAFSPDGTRIVTASADQTARLWRLPPRCQALIDAARAALPRELSDADRAQEFLDTDRPAPLMRLYASLRPLIAWALPKAGNRCE